MDLKRRIIIEKIDKLDKLSKADRKRALENPEHLITIGENNALKDVEEYCPRTPTWDSMRDEVLYRAAMIEGRKSLTHWQIFSAKPWYAKAAIGVILVAIVCMVAMLVPHERPFSVEQPAATGKHIAVHYADNRNLFGHVFNP
jgi:hypothetical protein